MALAQPFMSYARTYGEVNVLVFGADPTGSVDATAAFQEAVNECKAKGFSTLYIPTGVYKLSGEWALSGFAGLRVHGDGDRRSMGSGYDTGSTASVLRLMNPEMDGFGLTLDACINCSFEAITFAGAASMPGGAPDKNGIQIKNATPSVQFRDCTFIWFNICVQCGGGTTTVTDSEATFINCDFKQSTIGFQTLHIQTVAHRFIALNASELDLMFDQQAGGNLTVLGLSGGNIKTLLEVTNSAGGIGWNEFLNVRLDVVSGWGNNNRTKVYNALDGGGGLTAFYGLMFAGGDEEDAGATRFTLRSNHCVYVYNVANGNPNKIATSTSKMVEFVGSGSQFAVFKAFNVALDADARVKFDPTSNPPLPAFARYSFVDCQDDAGEPTPDALQKPIYAPNYLMSVSSHCWTTGDGLEGVNAVTAATGVVTPLLGLTDKYRAGVIACTTVTSGDVAALVSATSALQFTGGPWRFQAGVRLDDTSDASDRFVARIGYGNFGNAAPTRGVFFRYSDNVNSGNWEAVVADTSETTADTGVAADTNWHSFEIHTDEAGESSFHIDGVRRAVIPASTTALLGLLPVQMQRLTNGEDQTREIHIDYYRYEYRPTTNDAFTPEL